MNFHLTVQAEKPQAVRLRRLWEGRQSTRGGPATTWLHGLAAAKTSRENLSTNATERGHGAERGRSRPCVEDERRRPHVA